MKKLSILILLLALLFIIAGCDNGSVSDSAMTKSSGLVKVSFTVDGDSSELQKISSLDSFNFTYQYKAIPQWTSSDTIQGKTDNWTSIDYFDGMSLGFFTPGQWVFYIQILNGNTVVYEGHSDLIRISRSEANVTVYVTRVIPETTPGVFISVTAPTVAGDTLTVSWGAGQGESDTANESESPLGGVTTFSFAKDTLADGTYTFTLTYSNEQIAQGDEITKEISNVTVSSDTVTLISGYLENGEWKVTCTTKQIYDVNLELYDWNDAVTPWKDPSNPGKYCGTVDYIRSAAPGDRVSFSPRPGENSKVISVSVNNGDVTCVRQGTLYLFIMPEGEATIRVKFSNADAPEVDTLLFKTVVRALYNENDVIAFGKFDSDDLPIPAGAPKLGDTFIWYCNSNNQKKICWKAGNAEGEMHLSDGSLAGLFSGHSNYESISMDDIITSHVTDMARMFQGCSGLTTLSLGTFDASSATDISNMFEGCAKLVDITVSAFNTNTSGNVNMAGLFKDCVKLNTINTNSFALPSGFNAIKATSLAGMFQGCAALQSLNLNNFNASSATDLSDMFRDCINLVTLDLDGFTINTTNNKFVDMNSMFRACEKLKGKNNVLDLSSFNTSRVKDMSYMFCGCKALTTITVSANFTTPFVEDMSYMFSSVDLGKAESASNKMNLTNLDFVGQFNTANVTNMGHMFYMCSNENLRSIPVSNFNTSKVKDMSFMFGCWDGAPSHVRTFDLRNWDFSQVETVNRMFDRCQWAQITLPRHTILTNLQDVLYWFSHCFEIGTEELGNIIKSWDFTGNPYVASLFANISNTDSNPERSPSNRLFKNTMTVFNNNRQKYDTYSDPEDPEVDNPITTLYIGGDLSQIMYQRLTTDPLGYTPPPTP